MTECDPDECPHTKAFERLSSAIGRHNESHFWIHTLEKYYHEADLFRWHLNAYLKSIKEIPKLISMALQNEEGFSAWYRPLAKQLTSDPLLLRLAKQRDFVVHQGMLLPESKGTIGITRGRGIKLGLGLPIDPQQDSDEAMDRYLHFVLENDDFLGFLSPDDDTMPCIHRQWRLSGFDDEIVEVCAQAWLRTSELLEAALGWLGAHPPSRALPCLHASDRIQLKIYDRDKLLEKLASLKADK